MVSLSKITLEKKGQSVSLEKKDPAGFGKVRINLNWSRPEPKKGIFSLFSGGPDAVDLDLGCFVELQDGSRHVVQALGNAFGSLNSKPFVRLSGDDRTGEASEGEDLFVDGARWSDIRRILVYTFIYEGAANWAATDGVATVSVEGGDSVEVRLTDGEDRHTMCAVCLLENDGGRIKATKLAEYFRGHSEMDRRYGWGFRWTAGSKD